MPSKAPINHIETEFNPNKQCREKRHVKKYILLLPDGACVEKKRNGTFIIMV